MCLRGLTCCPSVYRTGVSPIKPHPGFLGSLVPWWLTIAEPVICGVRCGVVGSNLRTMSLQSNHIPLSGCCIDSRSTLIITQLLSIECKVIPRPFQHQPAIVSSPQLPQALLGPVKSAVCVCSASAKYGLHPVLASCLGDFFLRLPEGPLPTLSPNIVLCRVVREDEPLS